MTVVDRTAVFEAERARLKHIAARVLSDPSKPKTSYNKRGCACNDTLAISTVSPRG